MNFARIRMYDKFTRLRLNKVVYNEENDEEQYLSITNQYISKYIYNSRHLEHRDKIWNTRDNIVLVKKKEKLYFWDQNYDKLKEMTEKYFITKINNYGILKSIDIFSQNDDFVKENIYDMIIDIYKNIFKDMEDNKSIDMNIFNVINMYGVGGEFYVYFKLLRMYGFFTGKSGYIYKYEGYSNNEEILEAAKKNNSCSKNKYNLIDYNIYNFKKFESRNSITLINLSRINENILNTINTEYVITITCRDDVNICCMRLLEKHDISFVKILVFKRI